MMILIRNFFMKQVEIFGLPYKKKLKDFSTGMKAKIKGFDCNFTSGKTVAA